MLKQTIKSLLLLIICNFSLFSEVTDKTIEGKVLNESNEVLSNASIYVLKLDSSIYTGTKSNVGGGFVVKVPKGVYLLKVSYLGYETQIIDSVDLSSKEVVKVGNIVLKQTTEVLEGVVVEAEKEDVVITEDGKEFKATDNMKSASTSIIDLLRKVPGVEVDYEDNIKLEGKAPKLLIDGRESFMTDKELLKTLPPDLVGSVEVINNPSAKYEAEGVTGIINIKMRKDIDGVFSAVVYANTGADIEFKYNKNGYFGGNIQYKKGKWNLFAGVNGGVGKGNNDNRSERKIWNTDTTLLDVDTTYTNRYGFYDNRSNYYGGRFGVDYELDTNNTFTLSANINSSKRNNTYSNRYDEFALASNNLFDTTSSYLYASDGNNNSTDYDLSFNYTHKFEEKGHTLYFDVYSSNGNGGSNGSNSKTNYLSPFNVYDIYDNSYNGSGNSQTIKLDYERKFELLGNFSAGLRANFSQDDDVNTYLKYNDTTGEWLADLRNADSYNYKNSVLAAYFNIGNKFGDFSYRIGLRAENTNWTFDSRSMHQKFSDNYIAFSPSINLRYQIGIPHSFSLNYSRRFQRPWYSQLNPFYSLIDSQSISSGNPDLEMSYYNSYYFSYSFYSNNTSLSLSLRYSNTDNSVEYYSTRTPWGGIHSMPVNIAKSDRAGISAYINQKIIENWNIGAWLSYGYAHTDPTTIGLPIREQYNFSANLNSSLKLFDRLDISAFGYYFPGSLSIQGKNDAWYSLQLGVNYEIIKQKLTLDFGLNNLIYNSKNKYETYGNGFQSISYNNWSHRGISLGLRYRINDYQEKNRRSDESGGVESSGGGRQSGI